METEQTKSSAAMARSQQILRERARALAMTMEPQMPANRDVLDIVKFEFGRQKFGLERQYLVQVSEYGEITPLPATQDFLVGLVNVRGRIVPVYNLLGILDYAEPGITDSHQILHVRANDIEICLLADKVSAAETLLKSELQQAINQPGANAAEFLCGITADQLVIIDVPAILASSAILVHHSTEQ